VRRQPLAVEALADGGLRRASETAREVGIAMQAHHGLGECGGILGRNEEEAFLRHVTDWERSRYLAPS